MNKQFDTIGFKLFICLLMLASIILSAIRSGLFSFSEDCGRVAEIREVSSQSSVISFNREYKPIVAKVVGDVRYDRGGHYSREEATEVYDTLQRSSTIYLGESSRLVATCGTKTCIDIETKAEPRKYFLDPIQCKDKTIGSDSIEIRLN